MTQLNLRSMTSCSVSLTSAVSFTSLVPTAIIKICCTVLCTTETIFILSCSPNTDVSFLSPAFPSRLKFCVRFCERQKERLNSFSSVVCPGRVSPHQHTHFFLLFSPTFSSCRPYRGSPSLCGRWPSSPLSALFATLGLSPCSLLYHSLYIPSFYRHLIETLS